MTKRIFIITGEYSGNIHASNVVKELKKINSDVEIEAIGGDNLKEQGVKLFEHINNFSSMGISFAILYKHVKLGKSLIKYLKEEFKPDLVLLIDYGGFNLNIAKYLKQIGTQVFYYIPPQVWASRKYRIKRIKKYIDKVLCIFPFEPELYSSYNIDNYYCGHPLISQLPEKVDKAEFYAKHDLDINKKLVSVFPGSREFELKNLMQVFENSVKILKKRHPDLQFCISHAPNISDDIFNKYLKDKDIKIIKGENQALLSVSDALILASGTVALEACLYETPMIISYKGPKILYWIYLLVRCIDRVSLPNIIADKSIVPEILEDNARADIISDEIEKLLYDENAREQMIKDLAGVKEKLSSKNSVQEVAKIINSELLS